MKVFYIDPQSYNNLSEYDCSLLSNFENIETHYYCSVRFDREFDYGIKKIIFSYQNKPFYLKFFSYFFSLKRIIKDVKYIKPEILHIQWFKVPFLDIFFLKKIKKLGCTKIVYTAHNLLPHNTGKKYRSSYLKIFSLVDGVIFHDGKTMAEYKNIFPNGAVSTVIPHGKLFSGKTDIVLKKYQDNILRVSFLGSISEYKGIRLLVNAWLNSDILQGDKFELTVAGRGDIPYLESLRKIKNVIIDNRFISNEEMLKYYSETDITIMPYINISQSGVLLTNIGLHIPVIVSKVGGLTQPFEIKKIGYILSDISEKSIISTLVLAQKELKQLRELKGNTKEWEELDKFYDWKNIAVKTVNFYLSISKR